MTDSPKTAEADKSATAGKETAAAKEPEEAKHPYFQGMWHGKIPNYKCPKCAFTAFSVSLVDEHIEEKHRAFWLAEVSPETDGQ